MDWRTYPSHIGHRYWPGCFRCHDGQHATKSGKILANDCGTTCHTLPQRGSLSPLGVVGEQTHEGCHAWDWSPEYVRVKAHESLICSDCHHAGAPPMSTAGIATSCGGHGARIAGSASSSMSLTTRSQHFSLLLMPYLVPLARTSEETHITAANAGEPERISGY